MGVILIYSNVGAKYYLGHSALAGTSASELMTTLRPLRVSMASYPTKTANPIRITAVVQRKILGCAAVKNWYACQASAPIVVTVMKIAG
jgi:hypothetical protein